LRAELLAEKRDAGAHRAGAGLVETSSQPCPSSIMRSSASVSRTCCTPASDRPHSTLAAGTPTRSTIFSMRAGKPGNTTPALRPDAFQASRRASTRATDQPRHLARHGQAREPAADHAHIHVEVEIERCPGGRQSSHAGIPGRAEFRLNVPLHLASQPGQPGRVRIWRGQAPPSSLLRAEP